MKKCIAFALTLIFLLIPFSNVAMADSYDECIYEHDGSDTPCSYHISSVTVSSLNQEGEQKNLWCALFGHKLTEYILILLYAEMIDSTQCRVHFAQQGFCDRCNELVTLKKTVVTNHDLRTSGNRTYCTYGCGYETWLVK